MAGADHLPVLRGPQTTIRPGGFQPVGVMRQYERGDDGGFHDGLLMDLIRDDLYS